MTKGTRPPITKGTTPRTQQPLSPVEHLQNIERTLRLLATGELRGASAEDTNMLLHVEMRLHALRIKLEMHAERRPTTPTTRRRKP